MVEIKKIRLSELEVFVGSDAFHQLPVVPITPNRAKSYVRNPRATPNDVVLYLAFVEDQLVAFRSLFADVVFTGKEKIRFGWCSGTWVHPSFRRKGFSKQLLQEAYNDWDGKLMLTNYTPASEQLLVDTGLFHSIHRFKGVRAYLFPKTRKLLPRANRNVFTKLFFSVFDFGIALVSKSRIAFYKGKITPTFRFETLNFPDEACYRFIKEKNSNFLFQRGENELKWIFENPWISASDASFKEQYPFSSFSDSFIYRTVKVYQGNTFSGFFIFSVREGHLKTLYFQLPAGTEREVAAYLKKYCKTHNIEMATIYNTGVAKEFFKQKFPFLRVKNFGQHIYSSFEISQSETFKVQDGDGDVFFT